MANWDGRERRQVDSELQGRRDPDDRHCGDHSAIQEHTKEHRAIVCNKISDIKINHELDLKEIKEMVKERATHSDLKGMIWMVSILITICIAVVAGQAVWLRSDTLSITSAIQRLNVRVTENTKDRTNTDTEQSRALDQISGQLGTINWRLTEIESNHKSTNGQPKKGGTP